MSFSEEFLDLLLTPKLKYGGVPVSLLGIPILTDYKYSTVRAGISRLKKKKYISFSGSSLRITKSGIKYLKRRKANLQIFDSTFDKTSPKNLLLIFDIPEARKAERDWLRYQLKKFSYIMIQRSVWVGPSPLPRDFQEYLRIIKLSDYIKTFRLSKPYDRFLESRKTRNL